MPVLKNLENKIKMATIVTIAITVGCVVISVGSMLTARLMVADAHKKVYVIDGGVPIPVTQKDDEETLGIEAKSMVNIFHNFFFTLTPDEKYIDYTMKRAMYLIDNSGQVQYGNLKEKGFFNNIVQTNTMCTLFTDSITLSGDSLKFVFYGRQRMERASVVVYRRLVTTGYVQRLPGRTDNNPYGLIITRWRILDNSDISSERKLNY